MTESPEIQREIDHVDWSLYLDTQEWTTNDELAAIIVAGLPPKTPTDTEIVDRIRAVLYPNFDYASEWSSDEIVMVAELIEEVRPQPTFLNAYGYTTVDSEEIVGHYVIELEDRDRHLDENPGLFWRFEAVNE